MGNFFHLWPVLLFLAFMLGVSFWVQRASRGDRQQNFAKDYFIGGRSLGGFVLAMTTVATYSSVSTFVGGPGMAWAIGYGWLYMAIVQVVVIFLVLGIFGKKIAMVSRKIDAVTVVDVIRSRYQSDLLANISALVIVAFFCATMVAQFVGAAKLFEAVTGFSYVTGLTLFGLIVVFYTTVGGFKGVAITDAICAVAMIIGLFILFFSMLETGGGYEKIMTHIQTNHPDMLEPLSRGKMPISLYISQWLLVGVCTLALPQSVVRGISYKNTKALHNAMIIGTVVIGAMTLIATWIGVLSKGVLTDTLCRLTAAASITSPRLLSLAPWTPSGPASPSSVLSQQLFLPCLPCCWPPLPLSSKTYICTNAPNAIKQFPIIRYVCSAWVLPLSLALEFTLLPLPHPALSGK